MAEAQIARVNDPRGGNAPDISYGVHTETDAGGRPVIRLFEVSENQGRPLADSIPEIAPAIRDRFFPGRKLSEINWDITSGVFHSGLSFEERANGVILTRFTDGSLVSTRQLAQPFKVYQDDLNAPKELERTKGE